MTGDALPGAALGESAWRPSRFLWRLPVGEVSVLAGEPGVGKSAMAAMLFAAMRGECQWPDGSWSRGAGVGIWVSHEEGIERLSEMYIAQRSKADDDPNVRMLQARSMEELSDGANAWPATLGLIVIDTLQSFAGMSGIHEGDILAMADMWLGLRLIARRHRCPVLVLHHLAKRGAATRGRTAAEMVRGPTMIVSQSRCVLGLREVGNDELVIGILKANNQSRRGVARLAREIVPLPEPLHGDAPRLEVREYDADANFADVVESRQEPQDNILTELAQAGGVMLRSDLAAALGMSTSTLKRRLADLQASGIVQTEELSADEAREQGHDVNPRTPSVVIVKVLTPLSEDDPDDDPGDDGTQPLLLLP